MYVIRRIRDDSNNSDVIGSHEMVVHETLEWAVREAKRLAKKHAGEKPEFIIFELKQVKVVRSRIDIQTQ